MTEQEKEETLFVVYGFGVVFIIFGLLMWVLSGKLLSGDLIAVIFIIGGVTFFFGGYVLENRNCKDLDR